MTVAIKEGSKSRQFGNTDYLRTKLVGGGTCDWVREDARRLTKKKVKKDGTYKASDEHDKYGNSYFAFSSFTVAVKKKSITGKRKDPEHPDDPSYDYDVEVSEDENGELVETGLPHHVKITKTPNKLTYTDGDTIEKTGMVVKAYNKNGSLWTHEGYAGGVIPLSEITLNPSKADKDKDPSTSHATSELDIGAITKPFAISDEYKAYIENIEEPLTHIVCGYNSVCTGFLTTTTPHAGWYVIVASASPDAKYWFNGIQWNLPYSATIDSKKVYYDARGGTAQYDYNKCTPNIYPNGKVSYELVSEEQRENIAWTMVHGTVTKDGQKISAEWKRYGDKETLSDTFDIEVIPTNGAGGGGGGSW